MSPILQSLRAQLIQIAESTELSETQREHNLRLAARVLTRQLALEVAPVKTERIRPNQPTTPPDLGVRVWELVKSKGEITSSDIRRATGCGDAAAADAIHGLVRRGAIVQTERTGAALGPGRPPRIYRLARPRPA